MIDPITPAKVKELEEELEYLDKNNLHLQKVIDEKDALIEELKQNQQPSRNY